MKRKLKLIPALIMLVLCVAVIGVGIYVAIPTSTSIEGTLTIIAPARELDISGTVTGAKENVSLSTDSIHDVTTWDLSTLSFDLSDKTSLEEVGDIEIKIHLKNKSIFEYGAYFYKEGAELDAKGNATINSFEDLNTSIVNSDSVKLADVTLTDYTHIMPNDDTKTDTTLDEIDMTIKISLAEFFLDAPKSQGFKYILKIEMYQPNFTTDGAYTGSEEFVKMSSTISSSTSSVKSLSATSLATNAKRTTIATGTFTDECNAKKVIIPGTVETIEDRAFCGHEQLSGYGSPIESIIIPESVTSIGIGAFADCDSLKNICIKNGNVTFGTDVFGPYISPGFVCREIQRVVFEKSGTGWNFKDGKLTITEDMGSMTASPWDQWRHLILCLEIKSNVASLDDDMFAYCVNIKKLAVGNSEIEFGNRCFYNCNFTKVNYITSGTGWSYIDGLLTITKEMGNTLSASSWSSIFPQQLILNVSISDTITTLSSSCFADCTSLKTLNLPSSLTTIESSAFARSGIESISIPEGVTTIPSNCFQYAINLKSVNLPNSLTTIKDTAFQGTGIESISMPEGMTTLNGSAIFSACINLKNIILPSTLTTLGSSVLGGWYSVGSKITIKDGCALAVALPTIYGLGYTFGGWYTSPDYAESSKVTAITPNNTGADVVYCAKWTQN